jgi:hypothetical protein
MSTSRKTSMKIARAELASLVITATITATVAGWQIWHGQFLEASATCAMAAEVFYFSMDDPYLDGLFRRSTHHTEPHGWDSYPL